MGWAKRANQMMSRTDRAERDIRRVLTMFADRAAYEAWLERAKVPDAHRAHLEQFLPGYLQTQGTV